jgi:exoribonuclease-2
MITNGSLVLYKNRPALSTRDGDRLILSFNDGPEVRVRDKDVELIHTGPLHKLPVPASGGDFQTAWEMTAGTVVALGELADLVFGHDGPPERLACRLAAQDGELFRCEGMHIMALSNTERQRLSEKRQRRENEAADRDAFIDRARHSRIESGDERFWGEVAALALGQTAKSRMAADLGLGESAEKAQAWLLRTGIWTARLNPHLARSGHPVKAPNLAIADDDDTGRQDLTAMTAWAIDNAWSHDPDDAISWDGTAVWVHVADPASAIVPDSAADIEATNRSATLYLPEGSIPMLPDATLDRFGLGLTQRSRALSIRIETDDVGLVRNIDIMPSFVAVQRLSYTNAEPLLTNGPLTELAAIAATRTAYRRKAGSVDIDIPEIRIWVEDGQPYIEAIATCSSSSVVREMMVLAGEAAARWAFDRGLPFPYYSQEAPGAQDNLPEGLAGEFAKRRLMRAGMAGVQPRAHQGLGVTMYAQSTSPLRRYGDLLAHQQIRAALCNEAGSQARILLSADEVSLRLAKAAAANAAVRRAERSSQAHWTLAWLLDHPDWQGIGLVVQTGPDSTVYLPAIGWETRIKAGELALNQEVTMRFLKADLANLDARFALV